MLKKFLGDSFLLWAAHMAGVAVSLVMTIFVTRELGPEGRGVFTWLLTLAALGSHVAMVGLDSANRRLVAEPGVIAALVRLNIILIGGIGTLASLIGVVFALQAPLVQGRFDWALLAMATLPLGAWGMAGISLMMATHSAKKTALVAFLPKLGLALGYCALLLGGWVTVETALALQLVAAAVTVAMVVGWLKPWAHAVHMPVRRYLGAVWKTCAASYVAGLAYYAMQKLDVVLVGIYLGDAAKMNWGPF